MICISVRRALIGMTVAAAVVAFTIPAALAQPAPAAPPVCGNIVGIMNHTLTKFQGSAVGRNLVSIQRVSPINSTPRNQADNGFQKICIGMGLTPTGNPSTMASIDGDGTPDNAVLIQYNGLTGTIVTYRCDQLIASNRWDEGSGVEIRPSLSNNATSTVSLVIGGLNCSQRYAAYNNNVNVFPVRLATTCSSTFPGVGSPIVNAGARGCLCVTLNLPNGTVVQTIDAAAGAVEEFICGSPLDSLGNLRLGEAAIIKPLTSSLPTGAPVNCLSGSNPCPSTPSLDYPPSQ